MRITVETFTGGYSSDETLLHRVDRTLMFRFAWRSSHAGGMRVYEFSQEQMNSTSWNVELLPEDEEPFEHFARVRRIRVVPPNGKGAEVLEGYAEGVELWARETPFDTMNPNGVLEIRPVPPERSAWR